jgi:glycerophosphoryl diester phosphodiesterase
MKKFLKILITVIFVILTLFLSSMYYYNWREFTNANAFTTSIIMHAGGAIDGVIYTNSIEAFNYNYSQGNTLFELDFVLSTDGELIATHEFEEELIGNGFSTINRPTLAEYEAIDIAGQYTGFTSSSLINILETNTDIEIIINTKDENYLLLFEKLVSDISEVDSSLLDRIIVYIDNFEMYDELEEIYSFSNYHLLEKIRDDREIVLPYKIINFMEHRPKVTAFAVNRKNASYLTNYHINKLNKLGKQVFIYTINDYEEMEFYLNRGITGFVSDDISNTSFSNQFSEIAV